MQSEWLGQMAKLGSQSRRTDESASNFALGFVDAMQPKDAAELLLTTQIAAIHQATMMLAQRVTRPDQAARFAVSFAVTPSVNVTPSMTKGN